MTIELRATRTDSTAQFGIVVSGVEQAMVLYNNDTKMVTVGPRVGLVRAKLDFLYIARELLAWTAQRAQDFSLPTVPSALVLPAVCTMSIKREATKIKYDLTGPLNISIEYKIGDTVTLPAYALADIVAWDWWAFHQNMLTQFVRLVETT